MTFINPIALSALAFLAVPILIQFFINRRKIVLNWAAFEWMKRAKIVKRKKVKIDEILKLIAKLLLILLLVLFVSRPAVKGASGHAIIVIDNSPSMGTIYEDAQRLDAAKKTALEIIRAHTGKVSIFLFSDTLFPLLKNQDSSTISDGLISKILLSPGSAGPEKLFSALKTEPLFNEASIIYFISDFQKVFYRDDKSVPQAYSILKGKKLVFVPVDNRAGILNVGIESVSPSKEGLYPGRENYVEVSIRNYSSQPAESVQVFFSINGEKKDMAILNLAPYETAKIKMGTFFDPAEEYACEISLQPDALNFDNDFKFVFMPGQKINILSIVRDSSEDEFSPDLFFKSALGSVCGEYINYRTMKRTEALMENLSSYDILVFFGIPFNKKDNFYNSIIEFCNEQKSVIFFSDLSVENYFSAFNTETSEVFSEMKSLDPIRLTGTYFEFIETEKLDPSAINLFKYTTFKNIKETSGGGRVYVNERVEPLIIFKKIGRSNAIFAGFMPYKSYTDMFYNPNFVQFTIRLFSEALNRQIFYAFTGAEIERLPTHEMFFDSDWRIKSDGREERIEARKDANGAYLHMKQSLESKFCTVFADESKLYSFGANTTRADSEVESVQPGAIKESEKAGIIFLSNKENLSGGGRQKAEFSILMMALLFLVLIFDFYAHFIRKRG